MWSTGSLLDRLDDATGRALAALGRSRQFVAGDVLLTQGESSRHLFVLLSGMVKVTATTASGRTILLCVRTAGEPVGELAALDGEPRTATVTACGPVHAREIASGCWQQVLSENSAVAGALHRVISDRLRMATRRRIEMGEHGAPVRVARLLTEFLHQHGRDTRRGRELTMPLTQAELAAAAECSVASVQAVLKELREAGVVETRYRGLVVLDLIALRRRADVA